MKMTILRDDAMQRNGSKTSHNIKSHKDIQHHQQQHHHHQQQQQHQHIHHNQQQTNSKNDSSDSGVFTTNGHQHHHHHHHHHHQTTTKQRKSRNNSKRQDDNNKCSTTTGFTVDDWLSHGAARNMVFCYDRRFISSCGEENLRTRSIHRDSTSSDAAASDELNTSSSNEDLSTVTYSVLTQNTSVVTGVVCTGINKKSTKSRQNRQQKRKQMSTTHANSREMTPMDIDEETKENHRPIRLTTLAQQTTTVKTSSGSGGNSVNLRKQAALKVLNKQTKGANRKCNANNNNSSTSIGISVNTLGSSASVSSVCSTLSSASSTLSIPSSVSSSSASSSPSTSVNCSPTASPTVSKRSSNAENLKKIARALAPPLRQSTKLNLTEYELVQHLRRYIIDANLLRVYGYPVESAIHEGCIEIYKCLPKPFTMHTHNSGTAAQHTHNQNGLHGFGSNVINVNDGLATSGKQWTLNGGVEDQSSGDSGQGSGDSSPPSVDSDSSEVGEGEDEPTGTTACYTPDGSYQIFSQYDQSLEKQCVRCKRSFHVTESGEYISRERCVFHWGKLNHMYTSNNGFGYQYSCCQGDQSTEGCTRNQLHVWTGAVVGLNGPYTDFVHTRSRHNGERRQTKVYALDCEMSFTGRGLEVTKITVVAYDGQLVYEHFVRPHAEIVDYNTRFSGITESDLCTHSNKAVKTLPEVQRDLLQLFDADTILIGHGLDNDLRVLRIVHKNIIDTSITFPHASGFPYRRALKHLTKVYLNRDIQISDAGHSSFEDSRACLELVLWKVRKDLRQQSYNC